MKALFFSVMLFFSLTAHASADGEVLRVQIDWVNAKECGIDGCKPLSFVLRSGVPGGFEWPGIPERGLFQLRATAVNEAAKLEIKRTWKPKGESAEQTTSVEKSLAYGDPTEVNVGEIRWLVTVVKETEKAK